MSDYLTEEELAQLEAGLQWHYDGIFYKGAPGLLGHGPMLEIETVMRLVAEVRAKRDRDQEVREYHGR